MKPIAALLALYLLSPLSIYSQEMLFFPGASKSFIAKLRVGDSVCYYQCHMDSASQQLQTATGQIIRTGNKAISISEKFVIHRGRNGYTLKQYCSGFNNLPNRRFSGLKFGEKAYWEFKETGFKVLDSTDLTLLVKLELKGKDATEYDFPVTSHNGNQVIVLYGTKARQFILPEGILISGLMRRGGNSVNSGDRQ